MKKKNLQKFIVYVFLASSLIIPSLIAGSQIVNASSSNEKYVPLAPLPCVAGGNVTCPEGEGALQKEVDFQGYVQYAFNILIALSAVAAVFMIVWGGITYMTTDAYFPKKEGLEKVKNAVTGLLLVLCSYIILKTIDPRLVEIPSTLVPQITLYKDSLTVDATGILLGQIEKEVDEYTSKNQEIASSMKKNKEKEKEIQNKLNEINKQLDNLDLEKREDQEKYSSLMVEKAKMTNELNKINVEYKKQNFKVGINGILKSVSTIAANSDYTVKDKIEQIDTYNKSISTYRDETTSTLQKLSESNIDEINDQANYAEAYIKLMRINLITADATMINSPVFQNYDDGPSYLAEPKMVSLETKDQMSPELKKVKSAIEDMKDPELKAELEKRFEETKAAFIDKFGNYE